MNDLCKSILHGVNNKATKDLLIIKIQAEERDEAVGHKAIVKPSAWVIVYIYSQKNIKKFSPTFLKIISSEYTNLVQL
jgi:hypothetical protein